jgi:acyl-CoA dehydrogenase
MDFDLTETQAAVADSAAAVLSSVDPARVAAAEATDDRFDGPLWRSLAETDLLGLAVPASAGGSGFGVTELCLLLEQQGRVVAPVPLWATLVLGALPLARYGSAELIGRWLPGVVAGQVVLSAALSGVALSEAPEVVAVADGSGWRLSGTVAAVPWAHVAQAVVVPAFSAAGVMVALVETGAPGVRLERAETTSREIHPHLHLDDVPVPAHQLLVPPDLGPAAVEWMLAVARTGLCALQVGVARAALELTATHLNERQQFGRPLSAFQGTMLRAADAAIDLEAMRVTLWQAAWRLDTGRDAAQAVAVAKWQAAERGQRIVHATQHLHGGLGADVSYPVHRYFLWGKQIELLLGGPSLQLVDLGRRIADEARAQVGSSVGTGAR